MSNTKRPALNRHSPSSEKKRNEGLDQGLTITVDGTSYTLRQGDMSAMDTMALRRETGFSFRALMVAFEGDPDVDLVAAVVWLSRRTNGGEQMLSYAEVARDIGYDVEIDVAEPEDDAEPGEASDGSS